MNALFQVHKLNNAGMARAIELAVAFDALVRTIDPLLPNSSREKSIAFTKLEEACFFAKKAIASQEENQL